MKSKIAEVALFTLLADSYHLEAKGNPKMEYDPTGDGEINGHLCEIKYSTTGVSKEGFPIFFETSRTNGDPSALFLTHSRFYLTISPGYNSKLMRVVGKVRCWPVAYLLKLAQSEPIVEISMSGNHGFYVKPRDHKSVLCLGDVDFTNNAFDMSVFLMKQKTELVQAAFSRNR